ncbi:MULTISPECIES: AAA family ATPase [unclassified Microbulbifer]|uniref:AAA family ATPase n=1 Tax=unclassified Microbulbifer TaxID=2619833 RepID=UPI0027E429F4|nr:MULTISPECIES: AAA family ATPase [unclassified Microbulbifer]
MRSHHFYVITGASGAGKSTLLAALSEIGYSTVPEVARAVMREQLECNGSILPSVDRTKFMKEVLARSVQDFEAAQFLKPPVFFDRGIPEWLRLLGQDATPRHMAAAHCRYADTVLLAEPWQEIYVCDRERHASFERAARSYEPTVSAYVDAGYRTCVIPKVSVQERVAFVLAQVEAVA